MSKQKQKEAVYSAIQSVLTESGQSISDNSPVAESLSSNARQQVANILVEGFNSGSIELNTKFGDDSKLRTYVSGLISNWLRKDTRLNGGVKYTPAQSNGSRRGSTDPQIKALRQLMASGALTSAEDIEEVQKAINTRMAEIAPEKKPQVDFNALPESLRHKYANA
jgi:hypothetical protein